MLTIRPFVIGLVISCLTTGSVIAADPVDEAKLALEMWAPIDIVQDNETLVVLSKERRVTRQIYTAMISYGLCAFAGTGYISLDGIEEIVIVNRFAGQGYVFEGGEPECREVIEAPAGESDIYVLFRTHLWNRSLGN